MATPEPAEQVDFASSSSDSDALLQTLQSGLAHHQAGRFAQAAEMYESVLARQPNNFDALHLLGLVLHQRGQSEHGAEFIARAVAIDASNAVAFNNLAELYRTLDRLEDGLACCERALSIAPDYAEAHYNAGLLLEGLGMAAKARTAYEKAVALKPEFPPALTSLGRLLHREGALEEARGCYTKALALQPAAADTLNNLGTVWVDIGKPDQAMDCYVRALEIDPKLVQAHMNLGNALREARRLDEAESRYRRAVELGPELAHARYGLGHVLADQDRTAEALTEFQAAVLLHPDFAEARWAYTMSQLPWVYEAGVQPNAHRAAFVRELEKLERWFDPTREAGGHVAVGVQQPFMLAYQEWDNRELLGRYGNLCARLMRRWQQDESLPPARPEKRERIRVGIASTHFRNHSEWKAIVRGWFEQLDKARFELCAFHLKATADDETAIARSHAEHFEEGERGFVAWVEAIRAQAPDVMIYPEVGTDPLPVKLASLRLAPVQVVSWGYPETTGLPTVDYYLSAECFEPHEAQKHYIEQLVVLPNLGCCYGSQPSARAVTDLNALGLDRQSPLLICAGMPFKYAPQHDHLLVEIVHRLGPCQFAFFFADRHPHWVAKLRRRLQTVFEQAGMRLEDYARFLPSLAPALFHGLLREADAFLDTIGFSGFNTAMQAVEAELPIVTREGRFMRGRFGSGILKRMGMEDLVAHTEQDYVDLAVKLAQDTDYRESVRRRIKASRHVLFDDVAPIRAMEEFLREAVRERGGQER